MIGGDVEEELRKFQDVLGDEFGEIYFHIWSEWAQVKIAWQQYVSLFGASKERLDFLNECAGAFFARVERYFFEAVTLGVCRLIDPATTKARKKVSHNLTIRQLPRFIECAKDRAALEALIEQAATASDFCRDWRNRHIGHSDLELRLGRAKPLLPATRNKMKAALKALFDVLQFIEGRYFNTTLDSVVGVPGPDEVSLMLCAFIGHETLEGSVRRQEYPYTGPKFPAWLNEGNADDSNEFAD